MGLCLGLEFFCLSSVLLLFWRDWHLAALKESIMTLQNLAKLDTLVRSSDEKSECIVRVLWFLSCFFGIYATLS